MASFSFFSETSDIINFHCPFFSVLDQFELPASSHHFIFLLNRLLFFVALRCSEPKGNTKLRAIIIIIIIIIV